MSFLELKLAPECERMTEIFMNIHQKHAILPKQIYNSQYVYRIVKIHCNICREMLCFVCVFSFMMWINICKFSCICHRKVVQAVHTLQRAQTKAM